MWQHVAEFRAFLRVNDIPLCVRIPLSVNEQLGCFHFGAVVNNADMNVDVQTSLWVPAFSSFQYKPRSELLDHMVFLRLIFWGKAISFPIVIGSFYMPTRSAPGLQLLHILTNTCSFLFFLSFFIFLGKVTLGWPHRLQGTCQLTIPFFIVHTYGTWSS